MNHKFPQIGLLVSLLFLASCGGSKSATSEPQLEVTGARAAVMIGDLQNVQKNVSRPSAPLGLYANLYMSGGGFLPASAAMEAVINQMKLSGKPTEEVIDKTFELVQEFGTVLQVDVADMLNRSDDRGDTLDKYLTGLKNITERARLRTKDIDQYITQLREQQRTQRQKVAEIEKLIRTALDAKDYATAGGHQQTLGQAEADLAKTDSDLKVQQDIRRTYDDLLAIADKRIPAIEQNREILVAGLKVVNLPGAEGLGILEGAQGTKSKSMFGL